RRHPSWPGRFQAGGDAQGAGPRGKLKKMPGRSRRGHPHSEHPRMSTPLPPSTPPAPEGIPFTTSAPPEHVFPTLTPAQLARMAHHGRSRVVAKDEVLADAERQRSEEHT